jgi:hypothetical protein
MLKQNLMKRQSLHLNESHGQGKLSETKSFENGKGLYIQEKLCLCFLTGSLKSITFVVILTEGRGAGFRRN